MSRDSLKNQGKKKGTSEALSVIKDVYRLKIVNMDKLRGSQRNLILLASEAKERAYNPYSKFYVGAALLTQKGKTFTGCNIENASYGLANCAERTTIFKAVSEGYTHFKSLAIITRGENFVVEEPTAPCGACRQVINEFSNLADEDIEILLSNTSGSKIIVTSIKEMLPLSFGPADLDIDLSRYKR